VSLELIYTSVSRGLSPGSSGFCTAAATGGMSRQVMGKLEALSGYSFHFNISDPKANLNPVDYAHTQVRIGSETLSVLSRVAFCGADYSGRTNKIAHHFLLERGEQLPGGPAWMMRQMAQKTFVAAYSGEPKNLPKRDLRAAFPATPGPAGPATTWQITTGDAGWAGMLVKAFRENPKVPAFVVFSPGQELLPLFEESLAVLPAEERWQVGFATYYTALPTGCQYHWRGVMAGSAAAREMARFPNATVINLTASLGRAPDNPFTEAARTGAVLPPVLVPERPRIRVVERAPQPAATAAASVAEEVGTMPEALEMERRAAGAPTPALWPSPAQLSVLMARARRARWVKPLLAGNIALAAAVLLLAVLFLVPDLRMSWPWAKAPTIPAAKPGPTPHQVLQPSTQTPQQSASGEPSEQRPGQSPAPKTAQDGLQHTLKELTDLKEKVETAARDAKNQMETAEASAKESKNLSADIRDLNAESFASAKEKWAKAESAAKEARKSVEVVKSLINSAKVQAEAVDKKIRDMQPPTLDASTKEIVEALKKATGEVASEADALALQAESAVAEAEGALKDAKKRLDEAENKIKEELAKAPEVEPQLRSRDEPFGPGVSPDKPPQPVWPSPAQGNKREFPLGRGRKYAFLLLPNAVRQKVTGFSVEEGSNGRRLILTVQAGIERQKEFLVCSIDSRRRLVCDITNMPNTPPDLVTLRDWLVIEVADTEAQRVYQCAMSGSDKRKTETIKVGYNGDGKLIQMAPVKFDYPWPDTLTVKVAGGDPFPLGLSKDIVLRPAGSNVSVDLRVDIKKRDDGTFEIACSLPTFSSAVRTEANKAKNDWSSAHENLQNIDKELQALQEGKVNEGGKVKKEQELRKKRGEQQEVLQKAEEPVQNLLAAAKQAFEQNGSLIVYDAWGILVVELKLTFSGEAGPIIKGGN
jgi:hypothetical protein